MQKTQKLTVRHAQVLLVLLAFALMVLSSYLFVSDIEHKHLQKNVKDAISYTEANIMADMLEPETLLAGFAEIIRSMILRGDDAGRVQEYILYINNYVRSKEENRFSGIIGFYGVFDAYTGKFIAGEEGWIPPQDHALQDYPWYTAAVEANGNIGITQQYTDRASGEVIITFSRRIFDESGSPLGIVCLDIKFDRIRQRVVGTQFAENGYGFLLNENLEFIAHPQPSMLGIPLHDVQNYIEAYEGELKQKDFISERITTDYRGIESIVFVEKLHNGWYMGVVTPRDKYYESTKNLTMVLMALGTVLAVILSSILIRIIGERQKLLDTTVAKTREADDSKRTINVLENILNGLDAMIYVTVPDTGEFLFINNQMKKHFNIGEDCIGQPCYKVLQKGINKKCDFCPCHRLDKEPDSTVVWEEHSALTKRIYRNTDRYIEWHDGKIAHIQHSVDVTELIAAKEQAIQANNAKSNFLAKVSHEVRTPMNAILGITEIQLQDETLPPDVQESLGKIYNSGYLLLGIINDILDMSKIEAGRLELAPAGYDVASLINDIVHLNVIWHEHKQVEFYLQVDENIPSTLFGDELRIKQILNNLLSNAFKYTEQGKVSMSVSAEDAEQEDQITLVFRVSDTGQGMTPEQINKLFDEYTRFNTEANRAIEGIGLGMSITKHFINLMNGEILVESKPDKGSVFTVRLPQGIVAGSGLLGKGLTEDFRYFRPGKLPVKKTAQIIREYMPYGRVLIVDDMEINLDVTQRLLAPYGLLVETAADGFEVIAKIRGGASWDIIFMDHFIPKMDGIETTKIIRGMGYTQSIVAMTANALAGQAEMFLANGFDDFISKPIDIRRLNVILNRLVRDKYPIETIEAARHLRKGRKKDTIDGVPQLFIDRDLAENFIRDARKVIAVLETIHTANYRRTNDIQTYVFNVHSMKSALANIGETTLAAVASNLEQAGREENAEALRAETPAFMDSLRKLIERITPKDKNAAADADNDQAYLCEKLLLIQTACAAYEEKDANAALSELRHKTWPHPVKELLNTIAGHLLHSEFEEAAAIAGDYAKTAARNG